MDKKLAEDVVNLIVAHIGPQILFFFGALVVLYILQQLAKEIITYFKVRFDDIGAGSILIVEGKSYRVQKVTFSYIRLVSRGDDPNHLRRIPLQKWVKMDKLIVTNGKDNE